MSDEAWNGECLKCENLKIYIYSKKKKNNGGTKDREEGGRRAVRQGEERKIIEFSLSSRAL